MSRAYEASTHCVAERHRSVNSYWHCADFWPNNNKVLYTLSK